MGIYDRDYYRNSPRSGFGEFSPWSVTTWLIVINIAVFVLDQILGNRYERPIESLGYFSATTAIFHLQIWRFFTYQFLHQGIGHIFGNMLGLYLFGPIAETHFGARRYLGFYLSCGVAGAVSYLILWASGMVVSSADSPLIGASAAIFGVLVATAIIAPGITITLWFPPIPVTVRTLALFGIAIAAYTVLFKGGNFNSNAGGEAAHLGGAIWGILLMKNQHWFNVLVPARARSGRRGRKRVAFRDWTRDMNH